MQGLASFGGPLRIPHLMARNGPNFTVNYQWTRNRNTTTQTALVPTEAQRGLLPASRIAPQARALLALYPLPNFAASSRYNYQVAVSDALHQDDLQSRFTERAGRRDQISGAFAWQSTRTDNTNLFGFEDTGRNQGITSSVNWRHNFAPRFLVNAAVQYGRMAVRVIPFFANRRNVSGDAGITGNNQDAANWGPPALQFASGIAALGDAQASFTRNQTTGVSLDTFLNRGRHNLTAGVNVRRQQFNVLAQQDARGSFAFTGEGGTDFASVLLGVPDTASIAFGNADKFLRGVSQAAFVNDDWRVNPGLTINAGLRWEYE